MIPIRDSAPCYSRPWVTWTLIAICSVIFLVMQLLPLETQQLLMYQFGMVPYRYSNPEWAQQIGLVDDHYLSVLTGLFLHDGWIHISVNICFLWIFADNVEDRMGSMRFLVFYLLCGILSMGLQWYFMPTLTMPVLGASGAIAGVLAAYFFLYPYAQVRLFVPIFFLPIFINVPAISFLGGWVIWQLYKASTSVLFMDIAVDVAWWAHLGGFIAGCLLYRLFLLSDWPKTSSVAKTEVVIPDQLDIK